MLSKIPTESPRMPLEPIRPADGREDSAYGLRMHTYRNNDSHRRRRAKPRFGFVEAATGVMI